MLRWGFICFGFAIASGLVGATVHDARTFGLAQILFFGSVVLFIVFTLLGTVLPHAVDVRDGESLPRRNEWFDR